MVLLNDLSDVKSTISSGRYVPGVNYPLAKKVLSGNIDLT